MKPRSIKTVFIPIVPATKGHTAERPDIFDLSKFGLLGLWQGHLNYENLEDIPEELKGGRIIKMQIETVRMKTTKTIEEVIDLDSQQGKLVAL